MAPDDLPGQSESATPLEAGDPADPCEVTELMGADRVIFGSDWPNIEGMPEPLDYLAELKGFFGADRRAIMLDNVSSLNEPQPT